MGQVADDAPWERCRHPENGGRCTGFAVASAHTCVRHASDEERRAVLASLASGRALDFMRGVSIDKSLVHALLAAVARDAEGRPTLPPADFTGATFTTDADFDRVSFDTATFTGVTFDGDACFREAVFTGSALFDRARFKGAARFSDPPWIEEDDVERSRPATFHGSASFHRSVFDQDAHFEFVVFRSAAGFEEAAFLGRAEFMGAQFHGRARFTPQRVPVATRGGGPWATVPEGDQPTFHQPASFDRALFRGDAQFMAVFKQTASFQDARFERQAWFNPARFEGTVYFWRTGFADSAFFVNATFAGDAWFIDGTRFRDMVWFQSAVFERDVSFSDCVFEKEVSFDRTSFGEGAALSFERVRFLEPVRLRRVKLRATEFAEFGAMLPEGSAFSDVAVHGEQLNLDDMVTRVFLDMEVHARQLSCRRTRFLGGGHLRVTATEINLEGADFPAPFVISALHRGRVPGLRPKLMSVRRANVAALALNGVSLHACRFAGAHNLDRLRVEGAAPFAETPRTRWWTNRYAIAEEHEWWRVVLSEYAAGSRNDGKAMLRLGPLRSPLQSIGRAVRRRRSDGWYPPECHVPKWVGEPERLEPHLIAPIYRALRKAEEDRKNAPGAADFYYGEMEMRRKARAAQDPAKGRRCVSRGEQVLLWAYWLVSGYGLRPSRALTALLGTVLVFAVLLQAWGFPSPVSFTEALLFSAQSTTSLLRAPEQSLTNLGQALNIALRLLGPLFFGLMLLALRGRVKR